MDLNYDKLTGKVLSDWLYGASLTGILLLARKNMLNKAVSDHLSRSLAGNSQL
jgi:hypothetical protein